MLITDGGVLIRTEVDTIRETGRSAQGVKLINLGKDEHVVDIALVERTEEVLDDCEDVEGVVQSEDLFAKDEVKE